MKKAIFGIVLAAGLAGAAQAQSPSITQSFRALVVPAGSTISQGPLPASPGSTFTLNPGDAVLFIMSASFTPAAGTQLPEGTVRGIGATIAQIAFSGNANGTFSPFGGPTGGGVPSTELEDGGHIVNPSAVVVGNELRAVGVIAAGLLTGGGGPTSGISADQGVDMLRFLWTPNNYNNRTVTMTSSPFGVANDNVMWLRQGTSGSVGIPLAVPVTGSNSFTFNIVPAPSSLALLGLGGLVAARRRR